jgi:preprotein translocase subunit SecD
VARTANVSRPGRSLFGLFCLLVVLFGTVAGGVVLSDAQWTPKLALDLEGGTQITLTPIPQPGTSGRITENTINQAVDIIRQRVNGSGVSEAEVNTQGGRNIIVALPGKPDRQTIQLVEQAAQLQFRAVLVAQQTQLPTTPTPGATGSGTPTPGATPSASGAPRGSTGATASARPTSPSSSSNGRAIPPAAVAQAGRAAATTPATTPSVKPSTVAASPTPAATPSIKPTDASDLHWVTPALEQQFLALDCTDPKNLTGGNPGDLSKPLVTCAKDGSEKFILGPAEVIGTDIKSAVAGIQQNSQGALTGEWEVRLDFTSAGTKKFADVTTRLAAIPKTDNRNRFGIVLDGLVIEAPSTNERIPGGQASISGNFTQASAQALANQLKFGALPISFQVETEEQISALLGGEQLQRGLLAGLIGLLLVVLYSLLQYRALGLVTVCSLAIAGLITYGFILLLGWRQGYRLSLPGVAGLIVAIGITADSFIVYFERVRDEVRDGRALGAAVETAWLRARRTILASDTVSFLAAVVLYVLAVGGVRGFAFTLGLTTIVDVIVVFLFTKPMVTLLARTRFFGGGHPLSGFDPVHLGRSVSYTGRGTVRTPPARRPEAATVAARGAGQSIAERKAAERAAADAGVAPAGPPARERVQDTVDDRVEDTLTPRGRKP